MWPFNKSPSSTINSEQDLTEAQVLSFLNDVSKPDAQYKDVAVTSTNASGQQETKIERVEVKAEQAATEDPCNLQYYFDEFFMCYTPKSQLRNWYRYGEKKDCEERWQDFKWCMKTRMTDEATSQSMLAQRKIDMAAKVHSGPNSEDIWNARKAPLQDPWAAARNNDQEPILSIS